MIKKCICRGLLGAVCGIAASYLAAIAVSLVLDLGYFMPCPAAFPEIAGGEMNAVLCQLGACALAGFGIGAAPALYRGLNRPKGARVLLTAALMLLSVMPVILIAVMLYI